jgi:predicted AlkP superfamily pyrophosphatase or phosphodiesterase
VIISADGLRPDILLRGHAPALRSMMRQGAYTMWATTVDLPWTLPAHASMLSGVGVDEHGIWDDSEDIADDLHPRVPTIFELARRQGLTTALAAGKPKMRALARPGAVDHIAIPKDWFDAVQVAQHAARMIRGHKPHVLFVHLPDIDGVGHTSNWGSAEQVAAVTRIDQSVADILAAIRTAGLAETTAVIFTADHGGAGNFHAANDPRSLTIPWIITGPGIRRNYDLTQDYYTRVNTTDTFATACHLLGIRVEHKVQGKLIRRIFESQQDDLLFDIGAATRPATQPGAR